ncbi:uncharacterized protein LOC144303242 isoform X4 [Canis aureus]
MEDLVEVVNFVSLSRIFDISKSFLLLGPTRKEKGDIPSARRSTWNQFSLPSCGKPRSPEDLCTNQPVSEFGPRQDFVWK